MSGYKLPETWTNTVTQDVDNVVQPQRYLVRPNTISRLSRLLSQSNEGKVCYFYGFTYSIPVTHITHMFISGRKGVLVRVVVFVRDITIVLGY